MVVQGAEAKDVGVRGKRESKDRGRIRENVGLGVG